MEIEPENATFQKRFYESFEPRKEYDERISAWIEIIDAHPEVAQLKTHLSDACKNKAESENNKSKLIEHNEAVEY